MNRHSKIQKLLILIAVFSMTTVLTGCSSIITANLGKDKKEDQEEQYEEPELSNEDVEEIRLYVDNTYRMECSGDGELCISGWVPQINMMEEGYPQMEQAFGTFNQQQIDDQDTFIDDNIADSEEGLGYFEFEREAIPVRTDQRILSIRVSEYSNAGGAHPNTFVYGYNYNPLTGEELTLQDITKDYDGLYELVQKKLQDMYAEQLNEDYEETLHTMFYNTGSEALTPQWFLDRKGMTIYFNAYDLACYAAGCQVIRLDYEDWPELFKKKYLVTEGDTSILVDPVYGTETDLDGDGTTDTFEMYTEYSDDNFETTYHFSFLGQETEETLPGEFTRMYLVTKEEEESNPLHYLYLETRVENDYHNLYIYRMQEDGLMFIDMPYCAMYNSYISNPEEILLYSRLDILSSYSGYKIYEVEENGRLETEDETYTILNPVAGYDLAITSICPLTVWIHEDGTDAAIETQMPSGTVFSFRSTDGESYVEMELEDGRRCDIRYEKKDWEIWLDGKSEYDCFDMLYYAG